MHPGNIEVLGHLGQANVFFSEKVANIFKFFGIRVILPFLWCRCKKVFGLREGSSTLVRMCRSTQREAYSSVDRGSAICGNVDQVADAEK